MANFDLSLDDAVTATLTTGDDTLDVALDTVGGAAESNSVDGNGGTNVAVVDGLLDGDSVNGSFLEVDADGDLVFTQYDGAAVDSLELIDFSSITFDNGTLSAAPTATEYLQLDALEEDYSAGMTIGGADTVLAWDGETLAEENDWAITAVNGAAVGAGQSVELAGVGTITVNGTATAVNFTAFAPYLASLGLGETASQSITLTFTDAEDNTFTETFTVNFTGADNSGDNLFVGGEGAQNVALGLGNDTMWAGADDDGDDSIVGGDGNDVIAGGAGDDTLVGDGTDDGGADDFGNSWGGLGEDGIVFSGADTIYGGAGDDAIYAGGLEGGSANTEETVGNEVWAGAGDDTVHGADGADTLGGGDGDDTLFGYGGNDVIYTGNGSGLDFADGGDGNDTIYGGSFGDDDADIINGGNGNDEIYGGTGDDVLNGEAGADTLYGGAGDDTLIGGTGADVFYFGLGSGDDTVVDFELAADRLDVSTYFSSFAEVQAAMAQVTQGGSTWTEIQLSDDATITLANINMADLTAGDFIF